jgi:hemerythrin
MEPLEWNESYSVGNVLMDAHHKIFIEMLKEFSALKDKRNPDELKKRIEFLIEYAAMHFGAEERLMIQSNFPEFEAHKAIHDTFAKEIVSIKESFDKAPNSISGDYILKLMQDWLVNHILDSDKRYLPYVQKLQV